MCCGTGSYSSWQLRWRFTRSGLREGMLCEGTKSDGKSQCWYTMPVPDVVFRDTEIGPARLLEIGKPDPGRTLGEMGAQLRAAQLLSGANGAEDCYATRDCGLVVLSLGNWVCRFNLDASFHVCHEHFVL
jgi:hypothetical protein